jgi:hypothetical protein
MTVSVGAKPDTRYLFSIVALAELLVNWLERMMVKYHYRSNWGLRGE